MRSRRVDQLAGTRDLVVTGLESAQETVAHSLDVLDGLRMGVGLRLELLLLGHALGEGRLDASNRCKHIVNHGDISVASLNRISSLDTLALEKRAFQKVDQLLDGLVLALEQLHQIAEHLQNHKCLV